MLVPHSTISQAALRAPSLGRRAVLLTVLAILAVVVLAVAMVMSHSSATPAAPTETGSATTVIHYRGLGVAPAITARATVPSPATIGRARAEHSYGLVP